MTTINDYLSHFKSVLGSGPASRNQKFTDRGLAFTLDYLREELIRNKANKYAYISDFNYQTLSCIELELHALNDCECLEIDFQCKYKRSKYRIPGVVSGKSGLLVKAVTDLNGNLISMTEYESVKYDMYSKTKKTKAQSFIHDGYLFIANNINLKRVNITALFKHPCDVFDYETCNGVDCYDVLEMPYPMEDELSRALFTMGYEELLKVASSTRQDTSNDDRPAQNVKED